MAVCEWTIARVFYEPNPKRRIGVNLIRIVPIIPESMPFLVEIRWSLLWSSSHDMLDIEFLLKNFS